MEAQPAQIFQRVLARHQRARRRVQPVVQPGQQEADRRTPAQHRQRRALGIRQRARRVIGAQHGPRLGDIEGKIRLEAPRVQAHRDVVGQDVGRREVEVDQAGQPAVQEEHIVGKQVGMDVTDRQSRAARPPGCRSARCPVRVARPACTSSARARERSSSGGQPCGPSALRRVGA